MRARFMRLKVGSVGGLLWTHSEFSVSNSAFEKPAAFCWSRKAIYIYSENDSKKIHTPCVLNTKFFNVKYNYFLSLKADGRTWDFVSYAPVLWLGPPLRPRIKSLKTSFWKFRVSNTMEAEMVKNRSSKPCWRVSLYEIYGDTRRYASLKVEAECLSGTVRV